MSNTYMAKKSYTYAQAQRASFSWNNFKSIIINKGALNIASFLLILLVLVIIKLKS